MPRDVRSNIVPFISYRYGLMHAEMKSLSPWEKKFVNYVMQTSINVFGDGTLGKKSVI